MHLSKSRAERLIAAICVTGIGLGEEALSEHASLMGWAPVIYNMTEIDVDFFKKRIEAGAINIILANDLGQLGRRLGHLGFIEMLARCTRRGVLLATPQTIFNPSAPGVMANLSLNAGFGESHFNMLRHRMREGRRKAFLGGRWLGGSPPAPYTYCHRTQNLVIDDRKLADLQRVWLLAEIRAPRAIARELGMTEARVRRVLADDRLLFYQAKRLDPLTGEVIHCTWEAVMNDDQAERIRAARKARPKQKPFEGTMEGRTSNSDKRGTGIYIRKSRKGKKKASRLEYQRKNLPLAAEKLGDRYEVYDENFTSPASGKAESLKERARWSRITGRKS